MRPILWMDDRPVGRLTFHQFSEVVARARREVLRELPQYAEIPVMPIGLDGSVLDNSTQLLNQERWGEWHYGGPYAGRIVIYQQPYEAMPDQENYYRQIKEVLRHEYGHVAGETHPDEEGNEPARVAWVQT